jgi:hypothetical protein
MRADPNACEASLDHFPILDCEELPGGGIGFRYLFPWLTCISPYDVAMKSVQLLEVELAFVISSHG